MKLKMDASYGIHISILYLYTVTSCGDGTYRNRTQVLPFDDTVEAVSTSLLDAYLKLYVFEVNRPAKKWGLFLL